LCLPRTAAFFCSAVASKDWHAKVDGGGVAGTAVELRQFVVSASEADLQSPASNSARRSYTDPTGSPSRPTSA
jgi:hypothetical protein